MNWSAGISWLTTLGARRTADAADTDCADMGTAFGLDASLGAPTLPETALDASPSTTVTPWESRLVRRSGL
jgi:hypothetical protein